MQLDLAQSIDYLRTKKLPFTITEGIFYLEEFNQKLALLVLYKEIFPNEWANSKIPLWQHSHSGIYSDREIDFLELVNQHFFSLDWLEDFRECPERYVEIPIYSLNTDWRDECIEDLEYAEQFLLSLMGQGYPESEWLENFGFTPDVLFNGYQIDWKLLETISQSVPEPLSYLHDVASIIDHSTGCIWIDITVDSYDSFSCNEETLIYLAQQWQSAQKYLAKLQQFEVWIESSVDHRKQVVELWNKAAKPSLVHNQPHSFPKST